ncbi:MAG: FkbM family methyltransferase [Pseudomonas sp.]|jgi:FkbM family methyltransferase|nr:FkbM family methyltransferase [Pseudomonas sp.]
MSAPRLDKRTIERRHERVLARGLNQWPQEDARDRRQLARFGRWLSGLLNEAHLRHPFYPLLLPVDPSFSARMAYYFALGDYEQADLQLLDEMIVPADRVMECGAGAGVTGSFAAMRSGNAVVVVEPNRAMYETIHRTFAGNDQQVVLVEAAVVADSHEGPLELGIYDEYWWSSALAPGKADRTISVATRTLSSLLAEHQPTVLVLDIEGGECGLFPAAVPSCLRMIMVEIHTPDIGESATVEVVNRIQQQGFTLVRLLANTWVFARN